MAPVYKQVGKLGKAEAGYADVSKYPVKVRSCGICEHFLKPAMCDLVRGKIAARGGCSLFSPELIPCDVLSK